MKAISIRQPWAWLICHGHKTVENRTWPTPHRGDTLIHAGQLFDNEGLASVLAKFPELRAAMPQQYELGGIVGHAQLVACTTASSSPFFTGPYGFVMHAARPVPFVPLRGQLGFFEVDLSDRLLAALRKADARQAQQQGNQGQLGLFS